MDEALAIAARMHRDHLLIESAGILWLAAEAGILVLVRAGRRHLDSTPLPAAFRPDAAARREALAAIAAIALLCAVVYGRHLLDTPAGELLASGALGAADAAARLAAQERLHLLVWGSFVAGWVALEFEIVRQGWRAYRRFRALLDGVPA